MLIGRVAKYHHVISTLWKSATREIRILHMFEVYNIHTRKPLPVLKRHIIEQNITKKKEWVRRRSQGLATILRIRSPWLTKPRV